MNVYTIPDLGAEHRRCIPLTLFGCDHYSNYNIGRIENVGEYLLDTFPNCETCILELHKELTYEVLSSEGFSKRAIGIIGKGKTIGSLSWGSIGN